MEAKAFFSERYQLVIYGCGRNAVRIIQWMKKQGIRVYFCVDSSKEKQGTFFMEEFIIQPPDILHNKNKNYHIIVSPDDKKDIFGLLHLYGYVYERDYIDFGYLLKYWSEILVTYIQKQSFKTKFIFAPNLSRMRNRSIVEQSLLSMPVQLVERSSWLLSFPAHIRECYKDFAYYSDDYLKEIFTGSEVLERDGTYIQRDMRSRYVNVCGGMRFTTDQPENYRRVVHFFGNSYIYGFGVEDKYTLPSCLQRKLNRASSDCLVLNHGIRGLAFENYMNKIKRAAVHEDDYVLLYFKEEPAIKEALMSRSVSYIDLTEFLAENRKEELFFDWESHMNYRGSLFAADKLFELIFASKSKFTDNLCGDDRECVSMTEDSEIWEYIAMLRNIREGYTKTDGDSVNGGIVMNGNPFTLGHLHLIEIAAQIVDHLYVFVVSENRSEFDFEDRIRLVKEGTKDISNVTIVPSGKFILSAATFPEYFSKDEIQYADIDVSKDIDIFGSVIAKELNIEIRFVGDEPYDSVTKQYNDSMKRILPKYHVRVLEIPRRKINHTCISASLVRKLWHDGDWQELKKYVPECTYHFLTS